MFSTVLALHSYWRWIVLVATLFAVLRGVAGWQSGRTWTPGDDRVVRFLTVVFDIQVMLGLALYLALSPFTRAAFSDFGAAMGDSVLRFWAVEHIFGMLVALALVHVGRGKTRRLSGAARHRAAATYFGLALLVTLITIPWPGTPAGRPLFWS